MGKSMKELKEDMYAVGEAAIKLYPKYGILPSITMAQWAIESGWGRSGLSKEAHNYFGIKPGSTWKGDTITMKTSEYYPVRDAKGNLMKKDGKLVYKKVYIDAKFRKYDSLSDGIEDHAKFLQKPRYRNIPFNTDYEEVADNLKNDGYATGPTYNKTLKNFIKAYGLKSFDARAISAKKAEEDSKKPASNPAPKKAAPKKAVQIKAGTELNLRNAPYYATSDSGTSVGRKSGKYYIWSAEKVNGRYRFTNSKSRVGKAGQVTGWIKI